GKTKHHAGHESRVIPIFPELRPHLEAVWEQAEPGTEFVITRYRNPGVNLRTTFERIVRKAGLKPWPKSFQNCRSTRETELAQEYPLHVATAWIGNTAAVAAKHYLQVTDADFEKAAEGGAQSGALLPKKVAQNPAQPISADHGQPCPETEKAQENPDFCHTLAEPDEVWQDGQATRPGLEPGTREPKSLVLPITPPGKAGIVALSATCPGRL
ncbi:unnamed protein product, partial [marine sediment metagenome]